MHEYFNRLRELADCVNAAFPETPLSPITDEALSRHFADTLHGRLRTRMHNHVVASVRVERSLPKNAYEWMHLAVELEDEIRSDDGGRREHTAGAWFNRKRAELEEAMPLQMQRPKKRVKDGKKGHDPGTSTAVPCHKIEKRGKKKRSRRPPDASDSRVCYICREPGHFARRCPKNSTTPGLEWNDPKN